jgi:hypothetical protein
MDQRADESDHRQHDRRQMIGAEDDVDAEGRRRHPVPKTDFDVGTAVQEMRHDGQRAAERGERRENREQGDETVAGMTRVVIRTVEVGVGPPAGARQRDHRLHAGTREKEGRDQGKEGLHDQPFISATSRASTPC